MLKNSYISSSKMKKFIYRVFLFAGIIAIVFGVWGTMILSMEISAYHRELVMPEGRDILVCGDSQPEHALDPSVWPRLFNFSRTATAMDQRYMKLLDLYRANPSRIKVLLLDISIIKYYAGEGYLSKILRDDGTYDKQFLIHFLHPNANKRSLEGLSIIFRDALLCKKTKLAWRVLRGKRSYESSIGGRFLSCDKFGFIDNDEEVRRYAEELATSAKTDRPNELFLDYLNKIIELAISNKSKVILFATPIHNELTKHFSKEQLIRFDKDMESLANSKSIHWLNFTDVQLPDDCWRDANHLNFKGAKEFSELVKKRIEALEGEVVK